MSVQDQIKQAVAQATAKLEADLLAERKRADASKRAERERAEAEKREKE